LGWLLCAVVDLWPPQAMKNFVLYFFCLEIRWPKRWDGVLPYRHRPAPRLYNKYPNDAANFWLVVVCSHPAEAIEIRGPILLSFLIFFVALFVA
jgi:hypothetical protein